MKPEDEARLQHILDSADKILEIYSEVDFRKFSEDWRSQDLMIRHFEIIGEAAKHLSEELRNEYDDVEWRAVMGMRNLLIHQYFEVDVATVWNTVSWDLKPFKQKIEGILAKENKA
ncbi:DUF86 domain-containing protein [Cruoricaptor ignavus]|uniref:DUF86 domain-containing protein n=1 Tax=Cruoricaptor ignavus TaxID=1118202 RepID=A0A7M1T144_9FLAO|nr:HepT-like ribonuclease domain-containing protein [Cruoricaptor ignavus]QOR73550.1 DUF86 domain-containing protein [Cruoricaptor ignavus]